MPAIKIAVSNVSTVVAPDDFAKVVAALQTQVSRDFAPAWGLDAVLRRLDTGDKPASDEWWLTVLDDADHADSLGYHDITPSGLPLGKVFAKTSQESHTHWSVTASHELLEMMADPNLNLTVFEERDGGGRLYAYEVCDACEGDDYAYQIDGVTVSDFVFPAWFESFRKASSTRFDQTGHVSVPFQLLKDGYISIYNLHSDGHWKQLSAEGAEKAGPFPKGSRRARREVLPSKRRLSAVFG
jgi:hypothetical protein